MPVIAMAISESPSETQHLLFFLLATIALAALFFRGHAYPTTSTQVLLPKWHSAIVDQGSSSSPKADVESEFAHPCKRHVNNKYLFRRHHANDNLSDHNSLPEMSLPNNSLLNDSLKNPSLKNSSLPSNGVKENSMEENSGKENNLSNNDLSDTGLSTKRISNDAPGTRSLPT